MEIKKYVPIYKKAILDLIKKTRPDIDTGMIELNLECKDRVGYVGFNGKKFQGFIIGEPLDKETVFCSGLLAKKEEDKYTLLQHFNNKAMEKYRYLECMDEQGQYRKQQLI